MKTIKGPAIFLAQFAGDQAPFNTLESIARWAWRNWALSAYRFQLGGDGRLFDLAQAAASKNYCDEIQGKLAELGVAVTELSTHLQGQLVATHPAYDLVFDAFAPAAQQRNPTARQQWATEQLRLAARASKNLGLTAHATFSGALAWPYLYPWPPRPPGLIENAFEEACAALAAHPRCLR